MEPIVLLLCLQEPTTCPYPEPDQSSPCPPPQSHFLKIHFSIIFPSTPGFSKWSLSLRFPHQNPVYTSAIPHTCYMPHPSNSSRFDHLNDIWWEVQSLSPSFCSLLHSPVTSSLSGQNIPLSILFLNTLSPHSFLTVSDQVLYTTGKIIDLYISIFIFLDCKVEDIRFCIKW